MTGPVQREIQFERNEKIGQPETEPNGLSNLQAEAYGAMANRQPETKKDVQAQSATTDNQNQDTPLIIEFRERMAAERERSEAIRRIPMEGLDSSYHNFSISILDPRSNIEPSWFDRPLNQEILSQMGEKPPSRDLPAEAFKDERGNLSQSIDLRHGDSRLSASVSEGHRVDTAELNLLFLKLKTSNDADFEPTVVEIANKLNVQGNLFRVMELAQKIDDPQTRRGLQLAVLEESLRANGSSYLAIASAGVLPSKPETAEDAQKRLDDILKRIRDEKNNPQPVAVPEVVNRPGLNAQEQDELAGLCAGLWSKDQLLWNMGRAKFDWSR